jgi:hypothetical protein
MEESKSHALSGIPFNEVFAMVEAYHTHSSQQVDFDMAKHVKCVWFGIDQITGMYNKLISEKADGLRIYFGRYPDDVSKFDNPKPIPNTNSVILVSTQVNDMGVPRSDYFTDLNPAVPENRGEQCQPHCGGTSPRLTFA